MTVLTMLLGFFNVYLSRLSGSRLSGIGMPPFGRTTINVRPTIKPYQTTTLPNLLLILIMSLPTLPTFLTLATFTPTKYLPD
jgi:hypothetical protein